MTDEVTFPSTRTVSNNGSNTRTSTTRVRAMTQSSRMSTESSPNKYKHVPRPLPVWVANEQQRQRHHVQKNITLDTIPSYFQSVAGSSSQRASYFDNEEPNLSEVSLDHQNHQIQHYPNLQGTNGNQQRSRWNTFKKATTRPELVPDSQGTIDEKALLEQGDYSSAWLGGIADGAHCHRSRDEPYSVSTARYFVSEESRKVWKPRLAFILLNDPYVPLTLRAIIFILSVVALGLAGSIYVHSRHALPTPITQQPSTIMAVVVQSTALVYLVYITYDEYSGKPLGLREPKAKMRLIMLDLLFIIFSSANLSLTFNTLYDVTWTCHVGHEDTRIGIEVPYNYAICARQRGLGAFLFMVLVMWVATFTISIFRLVERVAQ